MSLESDQRAREFLSISGQFKLGHLLTESFHPVTGNLSEVASQDTASGLKLLFDVDRDVQRVFNEFAGSGRALDIADALVAALQSGGRVFFTGCGSTGRLSIQLDSIWRHYWSVRQNKDLEGRTFSVMAGGDFALIKSVEGFEDFTQFGRRQIADLGVGERDVVFAITEGGETSFVIGTAWQGLESGAKVYFVYNNPDDVLIEHVQRSREVILEPRIEKINLTTGPMAISGSTRMQATTIQLCVMLLILEFAVRKLEGMPFDGVAQEFQDALGQSIDGLASEEFRGSLARLVEMEEAVYRSGRLNNYYADGYGIDVLTDTTERSPTFCTPPFRKFDDESAAISWAFLFVPYENSPQAWRHILKRAPRCIAWTPAEVKEMLPDDKAERACEVIAKIGEPELMRFRIGLDGISMRPLGPGDCAVGVFAPDDTGYFQAAQLAAAQKNGAKIAALAVNADRPSDLEVFVNVRVPKTGLLLNGTARASLKMALNALSTCTMVRLGRVMGNAMIYVVPSNLKLIDRATRYIARLTGWEYEKACRLLFEVIGYVAPRMAADQAYPPVVGLATVRARDGLSNEKAEEVLTGSKRDSG